MYTAIIDLQPSYQCCFFLPDFHPRRTLSLNIDMEAFVPLYKCLSVHIQALSSRTLVIVLFINSSAPLASCIIAGQFGACEFHADQFGANHFLTYQT